MRGVPNNPGVTGLTPHDVRQGPPWCVVATTAAGSQYILLDASSREEGEWQIERLRPYLTDVRLAVERYGHAPE